ncbi:MAG: hypothetical protein Q9160_007159 [Pyrenula sp. 1 TL-2023]
MLASVISALGLLATSVFATPIALVEERDPSTFRISTLKVVQNNKNLNQQTQVTFSFTIQDLNAGPVNFCQYTYTTGPVDVHWTFSIDRFTAPNDFTLSLKHDPFADPQGAPFDAGIDTSANGVLAKDKRVATYTATAPPANGQLGCAAQGNGLACNAGSVFTVAARSA